MRVMSSRCYKPLVGAEFIGPTFPFAPVVGSGIGLVNGELAGQPMSDMEVDVFSAWLDRYNVGWVIVWSPETLSAVMRAESGLHRVSCLDELCLFERTAGTDSGVFLAGRGVVRARRNVLQIDVDEPGDIVLKYHWLSTLVADPPVKLRAYELPGDPVGFIAFIAPKPGRYIISNAY